MKKYRVKWFQKHLGYRVTLEYLSKYQAKKLVGTRRVIENDMEFVCVSADLNSATVLVDAEGYDL